MAVQALSVAYLESGSSVPLAHAPEEASQTFVKGSVLIHDAASGEVEQAGTEPVNEILGIAAGDASGTAGTDVAYIPADPSIVFEGNIGTSVSAGAIAATDQFQKYPLQLSGTSWFIDKTDTTNPCVKIVGFKDAVGTTNGRVYFKFLKSTLAVED